jgi:hypothetical protein
MPHLQCLMFLSPSEETLEWVKEELAQPKYGGYWLCTSLLLRTFLRSFPACCAVGAQADALLWSVLFLLRLNDLVVIDFSNVLTKGAIEMLAQADEYEVVKEVQVGLPSSLWSGRARTIA